MNDAQVKPRWRWLSFRLRTLLVLVSLLAFLMAWIAKEQSRSRQERQVAELLLRQGFVKVAFGGPFESPERRRQGKSQGLWRNCAKIIFGERVRYLASIRVPTLNSTVAANPPPFAIKEVTQLAHFSELQGLVLNQTRVEDLAPLADLNELRGLNLDETPVSDLAPLSGLANLEFLSLISTEVRDLTPLYSLSKLTIVDLSDTPTTKEQVEALKKAIPNCTIHHSPFP